MAQNDATTYRGCKLVAVRVTTGPKSQFLRRQVTLRLSNGKKRGLALSTLRQLAANVLVGAKSRQKEVGLHLQSLAEEAYPVH